MEHISRFILALFIGLPVVILFNYFAGPVPRPVNLAAGFLIGTLSVLLVIFVLRRN